MISDFWKNRMMAVSFFIGTSDFYLGLSSTDPDENGVVPNEPTGGGYARVKVDSFSTPSDGEIHNASALNFPISSGTWFEAAVPCICWCLFDGATPESNLLASGRLSMPLAVRENMTVHVPANSISLALDHEAPPASAEQNIAVTDDGNGNVYMFLVGATATSDMNGVVFIS